MKRLSIALLCLLGAMSLQAQEVKTALINGLWYRLMPENGVAEVIPQPGNIPITITSKHPKTKVVIPDFITYYPDALSNTSYECEVVGIAAEAFYGDEHLTEVVLPQSLHYINMMAFGECKKLKSIDLPSGINAICQQAFYGCTALTSVVLPDSLHAIGSGAFDGCKKLKKVEWKAVECELLPFPGLSPFEDQDAYVPPFYECDNLVDVTFGPSVQYIPPFALAGLKKIKFVTVPQSVQEIGISAFANCPKLKKVRFENSLRVDNPRDYWFRGAPVELEYVLMPGDSVSIY